MSEEREKGKRRGREGERDGRKGETRRKEVGERGITRLVRSLLPDSNQ